MVEVNVNGYIVSMVLMVNGIIDNLCIIDLLFQGINFGVCSVLSVSGGIIVGVFIDGEVIVLGCVNIGIYCLSYIFFIDVFVDCVVIVLELSW